MATGQLAGEVLVLLLGTSELNADIGSNFRTMHNPCPTGARIIISHPNPFYDLLRSSQWSMVKSLQLRRWKKWMRKGLRK
jgi:hypothetical protein